MVDVLGHVAIGLVCATPAWLLWDRRRVLPFVAVVLPGALLPDVDLYLPGVVHHGVTHTLAFVAVVALVGGTVATALATSLRRRWWSLDARGSPTRAWLFAFVAGGLFLGGTSHVLMDLFSTGAWERVVNPFWPLFRKPFSIYFIEEFSSLRWNGRLLVVGVVLHLVMLGRDVLFAPHR